MKIHYEPTVILVTRPSFNLDGIEKLLAQYGDSQQDPNYWGPSFGGWKRDNDDEDGDSIPELMGRLCYGSFFDRQGRVGAVAYLKNILEGGHGSVLEHATWGFVVTGASRGFTHQMVRHRAGFAFSQESQHFIHYSDEEEKGTTEVGVCVTGVPAEEQDKFILGCQEAIDAYSRFWKNFRENYPEDAKVKKIISGIARGLLPNALESRLGFTANARALRHFCELRGTEDNVLEIRLVACQVARIMMDEAPALFQDVSVMLGDDDYPIVDSTYRKV